ncbi:MAG: N-acetylglucosamine kinase [Bacteroidota bacterium]
MILIADSGSTKTDWRLIEENNKTQQFSTQGFNPYFQDSDEIATVLKNELLPQLNPFFSVDTEKIQIFFYGAGCSAASKKEIIKAALIQLFPLAVIEVETDLLCAARALCGSNPGIAAILGTGSNTCYYDGKSIVENRASLGFILGDEGSGAHIGKTFIQAYLNQEMPKELADRFYERFKLNIDDILNSIYKKPLPNRFLASFSKFIYQNLKEQFVIDLVANCFEQFFDRHICKYEKYKELKLSCVGSVAFYYSNIFRAVALKKGVNIDTIIETPIAGLTLYHLSPNPSPTGEGKA